MTINFTPLKETISTICDKHLKEYGECFGCPLHYYHCDVLIHIENDLDEIFKGIERAGYNLTLDDIIKD